jgi:glycosyltransferase involved in cell wall biosynthesis
MAVRSGWQYVRQSVASVQAQTFGDWELLVGINGLDDDPAARREVFDATGADGRIRLLEFYRARNKPQVLNQMVRLCESRYVALLDADDLWMPEKLASQLPWLDHHDVVATSARYFGEADSPIAVKTGPIGLADLLATNHLVNSSVVMRRCLARWPDTDGLDDYPLWLELAASGHRLYVLPEVLTKIRLHPDRWFAEKRDDSEEIRARFAAGR